MKRFINRLYNNQGGQLLISLFITALFFAISYLTHSVNWAVGDDAESMQVISGYFDGTPTFCASFVNAFLGYFLAFLYGITVAVPWYGLFHAFIVFISITIFFCLIFNVFNCKKINIIFPTIICTVLFWGLFLETVLNLLFTMSAIYIGCAAICLLFLAKSNCNKSHYITYGLSGLCIIVSYLIRHQSGIAVTCFWVLSILFVILKDFLKDNNKRKLIIKSLKSIVAIGLVISISFIMYYSSTLMKKNYETENFTELNTYRAKFLDYSTLPYEGNEEFFASIGWDEDFYKLVKNWIFVDERYNVESLQAIYEEYNATQSISNDKISGLTNIISKLKIMVNSYSGLLVTAFLFLLSGIILILFILSKNKKSDCIYLLYAICSLGGFLLLSLYLCIQGRFPVHIYQTVAYPTIFILVYVGAMLWKKDYFKNQNLMIGSRVIKKICKIFLILICIGSLFTTSLSIYYAYAIRNDFELGRNYLADLEEYSQQNKEGIYFKLIPMDTRVFATYDKNRVPNVGKCGGCLFGSRVHQNFINLYGYENLYSENFFDENVYLVDVPDSKYLTIFKSYMNSKYGNVEFIEVYKTEYLVVYDINMA